MEKMEDIGNPFFIARADPWIPRVGGEGGGSKKSAKDSVMRELKG